MQAAPDPLDEWRWRNPLPVANRLFSVTQSSSQGFTAVGLDGAIVTSTNGADWASMVPGLPEPEDLYGVACGNDLAVAVGGHGAIFVFDGTAWLRANTGTSTLLTAITFGGGQFVAVGDVDPTGNATILTSTDGYQWTAAATDTPGVLTGVAYGDGRFVAVGEAGLLLTSPDGTSWGPANSGSALNLNGVTYGLGRFLVVGADAILTSPDGTTWGSIVTGLTNELYATTFDGLRFVAVGAGRIMVSSDGTNWVHQDLGSPTIDLWGVASANGTLAAVGSIWPARTFATGAILTSDDTTHWTPRTSGILDQAYYGIAFGQGTFVAVGLQSAVPSLAAINVSPDAARWARPGLVPDGNLAGITHGLGTFVAVGSYTNASTGETRGRILTSAEGQTWKERTPGTIPPLLATAFGDGRFIAVGGTNVLTSTDALTWVRPASQTATNLQALAFGNGLFVGTGMRGTIQISTDGELWTTRPTGTTRALRGVAFGDGRFVTVGNLGTIFTSDDGMTWTSVNPGSTDIFYAVAHGNGTFVAVGFASDSTGFSAIWSSPDGLTWTHRIPPSVQTLRAITYGNGTFLAVGEQGAILQSGLASDWFLVRATGWETGGFGLSVTAPPGVPYRLQVSTNLTTRDWADLLSSTNTEPTAAWVDTSAPAHLLRFYRVVSP